MPTPPLEKKEHERRVKALQKAINAGYCPPGRVVGHKEKAAMTVAGEALGVPRGTMASWLHHNKVAVMGALKVPDTVREIEEIASKSDVELRRVRDSESASKAKLKDALRELGRLQDEIDRLKWGHNVSASPVEWATQKRKPGKSEHMPYLLISDQQIGEVIRKEETEHGRGFNKHIFVERYKRVIDTAIYLSFEHGGQSWTYPGIIYARGGDTISGGIHEELRDTDDLTPMEAVKLAFEVEAAGIRKLADAFGRVEVKDCGGGNHDRNTLKPRSKGAVAHSYDSLVSHFLQHEFRNDKRISFQMTESPDVVFPIYDRNVLLTHGDRIGSRGGQGFVGPAATIMRGAQKVIMEQSAIGRRIDEVHMGHFHQFFYAVWVLCNGCFPGYSEYAKMNRLRPGPAEQTLAYYHHKRGMVDLRRIILD